MHPLSAFSYPIATILLLLFTALSPARADTVQQALQRLQEIQASPELTRKAYAEGEERIAFCSYCHGKDGNSSRDDIPNLAAQNPQYLFTAFEKFASGERTNYVMGQLAASLSQEERINIALYFGMQEVAIKTADHPELAEKGKMKFLQCQTCHGAEGTGQFDKPRLAGQRAGYIRHSLRLFRSNDPSRAGSEMIAVAGTLSDADIEMLANYLQGLNL